MTNCYWFIKEYICQQEKGKKKQGKFLHNSYREIRQNQGFEGHGKKIRRVRGFLQAI